MHPEYQSHPAFGCFNKGEQIALKSASGRKQVNIHGVLNLENFDCLFVEPETVNFENTITLLEKIETKNPAAKHVHVFLDNVRHHYARAIKQWWRKQKAE